MARKNPYQMLLEEIREFCVKICYPKRTDMYYYKIESVNEGGCFDLKDLYHRTQAADQLGSEVIVKATDKGLEFQYVEKRPESMPWRVRQ